MGIVQVRLPEELSNLIDRQVEAGRAESADAYLAQAIRRYAEDLEAEDEVIAEAGLGILDAEAGHYTTISGPKDAAAVEQRIVARLQSRLAPDGRVWPIALSAMLRTALTRSSWTARGSSDSRRLSATTS